MEAQNDIKWFLVFDSIETATNTLQLNKPVLIKADETKICLVRTNDGFFAIEELCPHLGASFSQGHVNYLNEIICPWHSYRYHLKTGEECEFKTVAAKTFPVKIEDERLYVGVVN